MELISFLLLISVLLIALIFFMSNFRWMIKEMRNICEKESGYVKLIQLLFIILIFSSFFILLIYNILFKEFTSKLDIFLTVIVGLMGTIIGTFFSERTMESIKRDRDRKKKAGIATKKQLENYTKIAEEVLKKLS